MVNISRRTITTNLPNIGDIDKALRPCARTTPSATAKKQLFADDTQQGRADGVQTGETFRSDFEGA